jgi:3-hydroxyacyl-CoA dehydrogenase
MQSAGFVSEYDVFLAKRIACVMCGGDVRTNAMIDEQTMFDVHFFQSIPGKTI